MVTIAENPPMTQKQDIAAVRRARLKQWIGEQCGGVQARFIDATGMNQGELSGLVKGVKPFGEKKARKLEELAGMPPGYLSQVPQTAAANDREAQLLAAWRSLPEALQQVIEHKAADLLNYWSSLPAFLRQQIEAPPPERYYEFEQALEADMAARTARVLADRQAGASRHEERKEAERKKAKDKGGKRSG